MSNGKNNELKFVDQVEIQNLINTIFKQSRNQNGERPFCDENSNMNLNHYIHFNKTVSSEMFYSLMTIIHEGLPCSLKYYKMKQAFTTKLRRDSNVSINSPLLKIASPNIINGLSPHFQNS